MEFLKFSDFVNESFVNESFKKGDTVKVNSDIDDAQLYDPNYKGKWIDGSLIRKGTSLKVVKTDKDGIEATSGEDKWFIPKEYFTNLK